MADYLYSPNTNESLIYLVGVVLLVRIYEEFIYRGLLQYYINVKIGRVIATLISALLFGLIHTDFVLFGIVMGLCFGSVF